MNPFKFTGKILFNCLDPDSVFVFYPTEYQQFHWHGPNLDKLGTYSFVEKDQLYLELEWNYGREQTYIVVSTEGSNDEMKSFILKSERLNRLFIFSK